MTRPVRFHPLAELELREASDHYAQAAPELQEAFLIEVERCYRLIAEYPEMGVRTGGNVRKLALDRFPYNLFYRVLEDCIRILAVGHQSRRPLYWRRRV